MEEIKKIITKALETLYIDDAIIIDRSTKEECINHRLAIALDKALVKTAHKGLNVDVEYNRNFTKNNESIFDKRSYPPKTIKIGEEVKVIIPDIIIHKRGSNKDNLLCIEAKKEYTATSEQKDYKKIIGLLNAPYNYSYGCLVEYQPAEEYFCFYIVRKNGLDYDSERINVNKPKFKKP
jgi:DNA-directed RNA polymerase specialized sigma54-like protein